MTGVGRGLGLSIARAAVRAGRRVIGTVRGAARAEELQGVSGEHALILVADVTDPTAVRSAVDAATARFGRIDVLVNNAGYTLVSGVEDASDDEIRAQFETNTFGTIDVTRAVLPGCVPRARVGSS
ncbi:SDR family NAD(P)-dependent oxidoreductase [Nocardia rhamnosiphila]|uniref:SDR family NAD(P)-dependent oxidoreductase n=1 Tax=Nocardia rhamnosiphila TaxID=426716 RepID=A0ABV2WYS0_9NOCA